MGIMNGKKLTRGFDYTPSTKKLFSFFPFRDERLSPGPTPAMPRHKPLGGKWGMPALKAQVKARIAARTEARRQRKVAKQRVWVSEEINGWVVLFEKL